MSPQTCPRRQLVPLLALLACAPAPSLVDEPLPAPAKRFLIGNETRHDLFAAALRERRGAFLGVGGDACYTLMALAASEHGYLLDHDPQVVALHRELGPRIAAAPTPARFLADLATPPPAGLAASWPAVTAHLHRVAARPRTWLADADLYHHVHTLWRSDAVHPVLGDLEGHDALPSIARVAAHRGHRFTVLYLSNVEETLPDRGRLDQNLAALPRGPSAIVLRTLHRPDWPAADLWSYQTHDLGALLGDAATSGSLSFDPKNPGLSSITR